MAIIDTQLSSTKLATAKTHVYNVTQLGLTVTLVKALTKDELGGMTSESTQNLKAFPVRFAPFDRITLRKITFAEDCDVLFFVSKKEVDDLGWSMNFLRKSYQKARYEGRTYDLKYITPYSSFGTDYLYYIIGCKE